MKCPFCAKPIESYFVDTETARADDPYRRSLSVGGGRELDTCKSCEGIWFDAGEMATGLREIAEGQVPAPPTHPLHSTWLTREASRLCPRCESRHLQEKRSGAAPKVVYWCCRTCHGVWLKASSLVEFASRQTALKALALNEFP